MGIDLVGCKSRPPRFAIQGETKAIRPPPVVVLPLHHCLSHAWEARFGDRLQRGRIDPRLVLGPADAGRPEQLPVIGHHEHHPAGRGFRRSCETGDHVQRQITGHNLDLARRVARGDGRGYSRVLRDEEPVNLGPRHKVRRRGLRIEQRPIVKCRHRRLEWQGFSGPRPDRQRSPPKSRPWIGRRYRWRP